MNKTLSALVLVAAGFAFAPATRAADEGFFVNGGLGNSWIDEDGFDDSSLAYQINGGYRWGAFGVEAGWFGVDQYEDTISGLDVDAELDGFTLGINGRSNFAGSWYVSGRLGAFFWDAEADAVTVANGQPVRVSLEEDGTDFYAGAGLGYDFSEQFSLGVQYDYFDAEANDISVANSVVSVIGEVRF